MVVVLANKEIRNVAVGPFDNSESPLRISICDIKFFAGAVCFNSAIARKGAMPFPKVIQPTAIGSY